MSLLVCSSFLTVNAMTSSNNNTVVVDEKLEFVALEVKDLPVAVSDAIKKSDSTVTIESVSVATTKEGKKVYKVSLKNSAGKTTVEGYKEDGTLFSL